jgi:hypothetical protein
MIPDIVDHHRSWHEDTPRFLLRCMSPLAHRGIKCAFSLESDFMSTRPSQNGATRRPKGS